IRDQNKSLQHPVTIGTPYLLYLFSRTSVWPRSISTAHDVQIGMGGEVWRRDAGSSPFRPRRAEGVETTSCISALLPGATPRSTTRSLVTLGSGQGLCDSVGTMVPFLPKSALCFSISRF